MKKKGSAIKHDPNKTGQSPLRGVLNEGVPDTDPDSGQFPTYVDMQRLLHETQVHKAELEMQNAELHAARDENLALGKYADLYDFAPVGYLSLDGNGTIRSINLTGAELLGAERSLLNGRRLLTFVSEEDRPVLADLLDKAVISGVKEVCEVTLLTPVTTPLIVRIEAITSLSGEECRVALIDITAKREAEEELRASRRLFRTLAQVAPVGIFRTGPLGECLYVNEHWQKIAGITEADALGAGWVQAVHPEDRGAVFAEWSRSTRENIPFNMEYRFQRPTGDVTWVKGQALAESDIHGNIISYVGTITDITGQKNVEEKLRASEFHLNEAQRLTKLGSWQRDYLHDTLFWSDELFRIAELKPADFNNSFENYLAVVHPDDRSRFLQAAHDAHKIQVPYELEYRLKMPDGRVKWVHSRATASYDQHGQPLIMTGTTQDITERRQADEALRRNEELLNLIINAVPALISYVDTECRYRLVNRGYSGLFRINAEAIRGRQVRDVLGEATWAVVHPFVERVLAGKPDSCEFEFSNPAGGMISLLANYTPDCDAEGRVRGYVALVHDITAQKETEQALRRYGQRLTDMEEEVRRKLAAELHDEMGPDLTALNFNLALIRESNKAEQNPHLVELLADSGQLVDDLSSKVRNIIARLQPTVLFDYGLEAALGWYAQQMMKRTGITVTVVTEAAVPRLPKDHELALFRIAKEALTNAAKYSGAKGVTVTLESTGSIIRLSVSDNGTGFDQSAASLPGAGGWGLTIMRERTKMLGGTFHLETSPGTGTLIRLEIPKESADAD